jgi:hypothetical protein
MAESIAESREAPSYEETPFLSRKGHGEELDIKHMLTRNETLLCDLRIQRDAETSQQLKLLEEIREELASQSTPLQFIWNAILQMVCVAIGFLFGVFGIYGWRNQVWGNTFSLQQSQMNLVFFCLTSNSVRSAFFPPSLPSCTETDLRMLQLFSVTR